jgi:hypothetical protein
MYDRVTQMIGLHKWLDYTNDWITWMFGLHECLDYMNVWITWMLGLHECLDYMNVWVNICNLSILSFIIVCFSCMIEIHKYLYFIHEWIL